MYLGSCPQAPCSGEERGVYLGSCPQAPCSGEERGVVYLGSCPHAPCSGEERCCVSRVVSPRTVQWDSGEERGVVL